MIDQPRAEQQEHIQIRPPNLRPWLSTLVLAIPFVVGLWAYALNQNVDGFIRNRDVFNGRPFFVLTQDQAGEISLLDVSPHQVDATTAELPLGLSACQEFPYDAFEGVSVDDVVSIIHDGETFEFVRGERFGIGRLRIEVWDERNSGLRMTYRARGRTIRAIRKDSRGTMGFAALYQRPLWYGSATVFSLIAVALSRLIVEVWNRVRVAGWRRKKQIAAMRR